MAPPDDITPLVEEEEEAGGKSEGDSPVGPTAQRWWVLLAFCSLTALNSMVWITFAPIRAETMDYYDVSGNVVDWLSMIFMALYPLVFAPMAWYLETGATALQRGLRVSAAMNVVGCVVRWWSTTSGSFTVLMIGQCITSAAQGFTLGAPPQISGVWFPGPEWGFATGIGVLANQAGPAVAYYLSPSIVSSSGAGMGTLLFVELMAMVCSCALIFLLIPEEPARPPSAIAADRLQGEQRSLWEFCVEVWELHQDRGALLLATGYGLAVGVLYGWETLMDVLLPHQSTSEVSTIGTAALLFGLPGAVIGGWVLDSLKNYKGVNVSLTTVSTALLASVTAAATLLGSGESAFWALMVLSPALGFGLGAILSTGFEWGVEITYPMSESTVAGMLNSWGQIWGIVLIYGIEGVVETFSALLGNILLTVALALSTVAYLLVADVQKRQDAAAAAATATASAVDGSLPSAAVVVSDPDAATPGLS